MARINIDDDLWVDIGAVSAALGDEDRAVGMVVRFFRTAQSKFKQNEAISETEFSAKGFHESLVGRFATRTDRGIVATGSEKHFSWLNKRKEAGKSGGKQTQAKRSKTKQVKASSSSSYSPSYSSSELISSKSTNARDFIAAYCDRFKVRWGSNPEIQGKDAGIVGRLMKTQTLSKFETYLDAYFRMPDSMIIKAKHPLNLFEMKLNEIVVFASSGEFTTQRQAIQIDDGMAVASQLNRIKEGKL